MSAAPVAPSTARRAERRAKKGAHCVRAEDDCAEPDQPLQIVDAREQQADGEMRSMSWNELRQHGNVERADLGVEQVRHQSSAPRSGDSLGADDRHVGRRIFRPDV